MIDLWHGALSGWNSAFFLFICGHFSAISSFKCTNNAIWYLLLMVIPFSRQNNLVLPKMQRPRPCLLLFVSLVALDAFHLLLSTQLTANLTPEWNGRSMFHPLSHIYTKTPICCVETVVNNTLNCRYIIVFDRRWANTAPTLNTSLSLTNVYAKRRIHCLLISSTCLLSHTTSIYDRPKQICGVFWCFLGQLSNLGHLSVQYHLCLYNHI